MTKSASNICVINRVSDSEFTVFDPRSPLTTASRRKLWCIRFADNVLQTTHIKVKRTS